jgi:hypothetical protein
MKRLIYILLFLPLSVFGQGFLLNPYAFSSAAYEPEYQAVLDRATVLGYTLPSASVQVKQNTLVSALKADSVWSQLDVFYVFANDGSAEFATLNWKEPSSFQATLVNSPTFSLKGFRGNGTSSYINSNFNPAVSGVNMLQNTNSFGFWLDTLDTAPATNEGHWTNSTGLFTAAFLVRYTNARIYVNPLAAGNFISATAGYLISGSLIHANRTTSVDVQYYLGGVLRHFSSTATSTSFVSNQFTALRSASFYSDARISIAFAGGNLSTQAALFQTAVANYMNSL